MKNELKIEFVLFLTSFVLYPRLVLSQFIFLLSSSKTISLFLSTNFFFYSNLFSLSSICISYIIFHYNFIYIFSLNCYIFFPSFFVLHHSLSLSLPLYLSVSIYYPFLSLYLSLFSNHIQLISFLFFFSLFTSHSLTFLLSLPPAGKSGRVER